MSALHLNGTVGVAHLYAVLVIPYRVSSHWRVMAIDSSDEFIKLNVKPYLTCSETRCVVPASSSHLPKKISPKNGLSGFFSVPYLSLLVLYDCFNVLRNHFNTRRALFAGSFSEAGATNIEGCSVQYAENSVREVVPRMNGGAVKEAMSPLYEATDCAIDEHRLLLPSHARSLP